jgi:hypothetical protein
MPQALTLVAILSALWLYAWLWTQAPAREIVCRIPLEAGETVHCPNPAPPEPLP